MANDGITFLGHGVAYWVELQRRADEQKLNSNLLEEIVDLRGKLSFYEERIKQMNEIMSK